MNKTIKKLLGLSIAIVMCFAPALSIVTYADTATDRIVTQETFDDPNINTKGTAAAVSEAGGFWFDDSREGAAFVVENGTLRYTCRKGNLIDIRFYHDTDAQRELLSQIKGQDFILSLRMKAFHQAMSMKSVFTEHYTNAAGEAATVKSDNVNISDGTFNTGVKKTFTDSRGNTFESYANINNEIYGNQWYVIEYALHYDETATSHTGETGAYTSISVMLNGEVVETAPLEYNFNQIDSIRLGQDSFDEWEIDEITVATGSETLAEAGDFDTNVQQVHWINDKAAVTGYAYSMAVVGDTQKINQYSANYGQMSGIYEWILENQEAKNIQYVLGLGDITEKGWGETGQDTHEIAQAEWERGSQAISQMDGKIDYSLTRGNHDNLGYFNQYCGTDAYKAQYAGEDAGFFGRENDGIANSYRAMVIGETKYLFVTLNYNPTDEVLAQAGEIISRYPDHRVVITTHAYMYDDYTTISSEDYTSGYGNNDGEGIWNKLIRKYENICLVMSGHIGSDSVMVSQVKGDHGNTVTQMLIDFQVTDTDFGHTGMVVMLYFSEDGKQIEVETYSTVHQAYFQERNQFAFTLDGTMVYEDFSDKEALGSISKSVIGQQNYIQNFTEDGALKLTENCPANSSGTAKQDSYIGLRLANNSILNKLVFDKSVELSFKIKADSAISMGSLTCLDTANTSVTCAFMKISSGKLVVGSTTYDALTVGDWNEFRVIFNYDSASKGYSTYSIVMNGEYVGTFSMGATFGELNRFLLFRYPTEGASFYLDDIYYGFITGEADLGNRKVVYDVDFEEWNGHILNNANRKSHNGFRLMNVWDNSTNEEITPKSYVSNGIVTALWHGNTGSGNPYKQGFLDVMLNDNGTPLTYGDMTFTMEIKPIGSIASTVMDLRGLTAATGTSTQSRAIISATNENGVNYLSVKGGSKKAELSDYRFSTVEITLEYDYTANQYSAASLYVNGEYVESVSFDGLDSITYFRMFYSVTTWIKAGNGLQIDSMKITEGKQATYKGETSVTDFIGYQATVVDEETGKYSVRLLAVITDAELSKYENVGFKVQLEYKSGAKVTMPDEYGVCTEVYSSVSATEGIDKTYTAEELGGAAIFALNCLNIPAEDGAVTFTVTTYYTLAGKETVAERTMVFSIDPTVDLPVKEV